MAPIGQECRRLTLLAGIDNVFKLAKVLLVAVKHGPRKIESSAST